MRYPESLQKLIHYYAKLPGIGEKSAERMALATIELQSDQIRDFAESIINAKEKLIQCNICGNLTENEVCDICLSEERNKNVICVIEDYKSAFSFEKAEKYNGVYHVLNGLISPMNSIGPNDINISSLVKRVAGRKNVELILALKSSIEGETTILYIKKIFANKDIKISRLSYGLPMGAEIDYLDMITLDKALEDRKIISMPE